MSTIDHSKQLADLKCTDIGLVKDVLSPRLEGDSPHFKLHIEFRDGCLGGVKVINLIRAVDSSRRILIILTENFLQVRSRRGWVQG